MPCKDTEERKEKDRLYYLKNREKKLEWQRQYRLKNKDKIKEYNINRYYELKEIRLKEEQEGYAAADGIFN